MRDKDRIDKFLTKFGELWKDNCFDLRFGQLVCNLQKFYNSDLFYVEEDKMIYLLEKFFNLKMDKNNIGANHD